MDDMQQKRSPDHRTPSSLDSPSPNASTSSQRRSSFSDLLTTVRPPTVATPSNGWARRAQASTSLENARQRSVLLKSVSHLHIDAQQSSAVPLSEADPDAHAETPFTRFDLIQPPEYRAKVKKGRGWSFSEESRRDSVLNSGSLYSTTTPNASQISLSISSNRAAQGKARAVSAAAKIRKQLTNPKPPSSNDIQRYRAASSSRLNSSSTEPSASSQSDIAAPDLSFSSSSTASNTMPSFDQKPPIAAAATTSTTTRASLGETSHSDRRPGSHTSKDNPDDQSLNADLSPSATRGSSSINGSASHDRVSRHLKHLEQQMDPISTDAPFDDDDHPGETSAVISQRLHHKTHQQEIPESDLLAERDGDSPSDIAAVDQSSNSSPSGAYTQSLDTPALPHNLLINREARVSFDCSQRVRLQSSESGLSQISSRRPSSLLLNSLVSEENSDMADIESRNISYARRGSSSSSTKIKSSLRLGMMRLTGSTVDLHNFESPENEHRRGAHLERGQTDDEGPMGSPLTPSDSPPRSRFSFSLNRRRPSQEVAAIKPASTFSLLSKFNRSRDALEVATVDAEDGTVLVAPAPIKGRKSSDASLTTRQYVLKAMRRSSRPSIPASDLATVATMPGTISTGKDETKAAAPSQQTADTVFASAFGAPHKSDAQSAQAFESDRPLTSGVDAYPSTDSFNGQMSQYHSPSRPASQDSGSTSFFSIAASTSHPDTISRPPSRFLSPFGSIRSHARGNEHSSQHNPAQRATPDTPSSEGESRGEQRDAPLLSHNSEEEQQQQQRPFSNSFDMSADNAAALSPSLPGASTNVSPSEHGSYLSRSTAPSSMLPPDSMTNAALHLENESGLVAAKHVSEGERPTDATSTESPNAELQGGRATEPQDSSNNNNTSSGNANGSRRPGRSSRLLHLPRLNSMHVVSRSSGGGTNGGGQDGNGGDDQRRRPEESMGASGAVEEHSSGAESDEDVSMPTHEDTGSETDSGSEAEISMDSEAETSIGQRSLPPISPTRSHPEEMPRSRPGALSLPPSSLFLNSSSAATSSPLQDRSLFTKTVVGREAWQQFASLASPSETPGIFTTPRPLTMPGAASQRMTPAGNSSRTPQGPANADDSSYFDIRPTPSTRTDLSNSSDMPPPSPSIITRSRAASSASRRSARSSSLRDLPPVPPISPLQFRGVNNAIPSRTMSPNQASPVKRDSLPPLPSYRSAAPGDLSLLTKRTSSRSDADRVDQAESSRAPSASQAPSSSAVKTKGRPTLYQQQSRSLIDLSAARMYKEPMRMPTPTINALQQPKEQAANESGLRTPTAPLTPGGLRRRRSMFEVGAQPPPYAVIHARPEGPQMIFPREEEGKEALPRYTCSVHIEGYLPRKMEFSSPGLQAKDRSWRRQYFVLHGTCLKVYKTDLSGENLVSKGAWGEVEGVHVHKDPMNEDGPAGPLANGGAPPKDGSSSASFNNGHGHSNSVGNTSTSSGFNAAVEAVSALKGSIYSGSKGSLIKTYSLQGAESGLAADYLKRRHVVRVRVEGEQFLLQTRNDRHVVDWIEAFQAATNVALDLERRPMPKFITLPRRRRRRRREGAGAEGDPVAAREEAELQEARRRSLADAQASGSEGRRSMNASRATPARPLGLPGDESPIPSAAFDDMLREEHEGIMRQDASEV